MSVRFEIDRRSFLRLFGGGIAVFVTYGPEELFAQTRPYPEDLNAYLRIGADGRVTVFSGKIEMGQGITTSLAQMAAEELGVGLESIDMVLGDTDLCPWDRGTFGSLTTRQFGPALRAAAAEARTVLMRLAAKRLGAPVGQLAVADGVVSAAGLPGRSVSYGELAQGRAIARLVGEEAVQRKAAEMTVMRTSPVRLDGRVKVTGAAIYAADVRRPGMLHAAILRPPAHGAELLAVDTAEAAERPGVVLVREDDLIAVLHEDADAARAALGAVRATWSEVPAKPDSESIYDHLVRVAGSGDEFDARGNPDAARAGARHVVETTYRKGYVAHAAIEPHAAVADPAGGRMTVWASTQTPFPARARIAEALGVAEEKVRVVVPLVGGGFGGKSPHQQAIEAARLARAARRPVQVAWSRAEEFFFDTFDPAAVARVAAGLDGDGRLAFWSYDVYGAGTRGAELLYDVPHVRMRSFGGRMSRSEERIGERLHPFGVGAWRAPGANMNVFARESQLDALAAAAGIDPLELRLRNTSDPRLRRVLETAAEAYGWRGRKGGVGRGHGLACGAAAGTYVALMAEVEVDRATGAVRVGRVVCAQEMGLVVSPEGARMQVEGCIVMGLGYALSEELRFAGGRILDVNFDSYALPRFSWVPEIETVLVEASGRRSQGGGEPAITPMGAVLANAVFAATGARLDRLPMTPERVRAAVAAPRSDAA